MRKIIKLFETGNVIVTGLRGRGKDMLMSNVAIRRKKPYVSNVNYGGVHHPLSLKDFDVGNDYRDFIDGKLTPYVYPFSDGTDIYISDGSVYFPNFACQELNRNYQGLFQFMALSRHLGECNVHINTQNIGRLWDKLREQSDIYIRCLRCIYISPLRLVIQHVRIYEQYDACANNVPPMPRPALFSRVPKEAYELQKIGYQATHGEIKSRLLIYFNKSKYDTRIFKSMLDNASLKEYNEMKEVI